MLKKKLDLAIIGNSYISYLLAFQMLNENKNVLIVDDKRLHVEEGFFTTMTECELNFLKSWSDDLRVNDISDYDALVSVSPFLLRFSHTEVLLGRDCAYNNLQELSRKIPYLFTLPNLDQDEFNKSFSLSNQRLGLSLCRFKTIQNLNISTLLSVFDDKVISSFLEFERRVQKADESLKDEIELFLYSSRCIYHNVLTTSKTRVELFYLFISLLSPRFILDYREVIPKLGRVLESRGGHLRRCKISDWSFSSGRPWSVVLDSFEGVIRPKKIVFVGGSLEKLPLGLVEENCYGNYVVRMKKKFSLGGELPIYNFKSRYVGTNFVFWQCSENQDEHIVDICGVRGNCEKIDFSKKDILSLLKNNSVIQDDDDVLGVDYGNKVVGSGIVRINNLASESHLVDTSQATNHKPIKNVYYYGPSQRSPLGVLTTLMQARDYRSFL